MTNLRPIAAAALGSAALLSLAAAQPSALAGVAPGLWEIRGAPGAAKPVRQCVAQVAALAQFEHRGQSCTRVLINSEGASATYHYTCAAGGFGQSSISVITPRALRVETQGISDNAPFNYVLQAHRIGDCPAG